MSALLNAINVHTLGSVHITNNQNNYERSDALKIVPVRGNTVFSDIYICNSFEIMYYLLKEILIASAAN